jgi:hypothetical protein
MKIVKTYSIVVLLFATLFISVFSGCDDANDWGVDSSYKRMFRPTTLAVTEVTATTGKVQWTSIPGTGKYILELSKDSLLFQNVIKTIETDTIVFDLIDLEGTTQYSVRVKAQSNDVTIPESAFVSFYFKTKSEQIMAAVGPGDLTATTALLRWTAGLAVTNLVLVDGGGAVVMDVVLTDEDKNKGEKLIEGLSPRTTYTASIFNSDNKRGTVTFLTYPEVPAADYIVYLTEDDIIDQAFFDGLQQYGSVTLSMPAGASYNSSTAITLPAGMSVHFFGLPGAVKPKLSINQIKLNVSHAYLRFSNVDVSGIGYDKAGVPTGETYNYLINQSDAAVVDAIEFEDCLLRNFNNTPFRLQSTGAKSIKSLKINKCIVSNMQDTYYFINTNIADGIINDIIITNSTFYNVPRFIMHSGASNNSIIVEDCTFNDVIGAGRYFIDMSANFSSANLMVKDCILGASKSATARGIRSSGTAAILNTYSTTDWITGSNAIVGLLPYSGTSTSLFANPGAGDFKIKDELFEGKSTTGDPQWRIE